MPILSNEQVTKMQDYMKENGLTDSHIKKVRNMMGLDKPKSTKKVEPPKTKKVTKPTTIKKVTKPTKPTKDIKKKGK
jgi:hypothetical protein